MTPSVAIAPLQPALPVHMRWMIRRDLPEVLRIDEQSFEYYWMEEDFLAVLRARNCIGMVAERGETVVGFMVYELFRDRLHLTKIAVDPKHRLHGVGRQMIAKLIGKLSAHRRRRITIDVRESNLPAQKFFRSIDFRATKVLRAHLADSGEDAYRMQYIRREEIPE